jgi:uridine kinase
MGSPVASPTRSALLAALAARLVAHPDRALHPLRVAVDGVTGAGKSTFAAELAEAVTVLGVPGLHLTTDDFHHPAAHRRADPDRARGYYRDAFDLPSIRRLVLDPLGRGLPYVPRLHELATDAQLDEPARLAPDGAVVVVDGTFLQVPALAGTWDVVVWLATSLPVAERRAVARDAVLLGGADAARTAYRDRYHAACRLYLAEIRPERAADLVVDNDDLAAPVLRTDRLSAAPARNADGAAPA